MPKIKNDCQDYIRVASHHQDLSRRRRQSLWPDLVACLVLFVCLALLFWYAGKSKGSTLLAPAPFSRGQKITAKSIEGEWWLTWNGVDCWCALLPEGRWRCRWYGDDWHGTWTLKGSTLTVKEHSGRAKGFVNPEGTRQSTWSVKLIDRRGTRKRWTAIDGEGPHGIGTLWRRKAK